MGGEDEGTGPSRLPSFWPPRPIRFLGETYLTVLHNLISPCPWLGWAGLVVLTNGHGTGTGTGTGRGSRTKMDKVR
jgi:hypothetical protein